MRPTRSLTAAASLICLTLTLVVGCGACSSSKPKRSMTLFEEIGNTPVMKEDIGWPEERDKRIEFFWAKPATGTGPFPTLVMIHGFQQPQRPGGRDFVRNGMLRAMAEKGILAVSVSMPGYGSSDGPADLAGPRSVKALLNVVAYLKELGLADPGRISLWGTGRGAMTAGLAVAQDSSFRSAVLVSPILDPGAVYRKLKASGDDALSQMGAQMADEMDTGDEGVRARSLMANAPSIKSPVLAIIGAKDEFADPENGNDFARVVNSSGGRAKVVILPNSGNFIPGDTRNFHAIPFLNETLLKK